MRILLSKINGIFLETLAYPSLQFVNHIAIPIKFKGLIFGNLFQQNSFNIYITYPQKIFLLKKYKTFGFQLLDP